MKLNIIGYKNLDNKALLELVEKVKEAENILPYSNEVKDSLQKLGWQLQVELNKRERSKYVWVEFSCSWSGYSNNPSAPRRTIGVEYRKLDREIALKLPNYWSYVFSDGSTNDWSIDIVSVRPKNSKGSSYPHQIDELLISLKGAK